MLNTILRVMLIVILLPMFAMCSISMIGGAGLGVQLAEEAEKRELEETTNGPHPVQ